MVRSGRKTKQQMLMQTGWVRAVTALALLLLAYGFASLAIDSGNLLEYAVTIVLLCFGIKYLIRSVRSLF